MRTLLLGLMLTLACSPAVTKMHEVHGMMDASMMPVIASIISEADHQRIPFTTNYIKISIDSPGGYVYMLDRFIDAFDYAKSRGYKIKCYLRDKGAASAAALLYTQCDVRLAYKKAKLLFHDVAVGFFMVRLNRAAAKQLYLDLDDEQQRLEDLARSTFTVSDTLFRFLNDNEVFFTAEQAEEFSPMFINGFIKRTKLPQW